MTPSSHASNRIANWEPWILGGALILPSIITYAYFVHLAKSPSHWQQVAYVVGKVVQFGIPLWWMVGVLRETWTFWPTRPAAWSRGAWIGITIAGLMLAGYFLVLRPLPISETLTTAVQGKIAGLQMSTPLRYLVLSAFYCVVHSLLEEYYWRWYVYGRLRTHLAVAPAIGVSSLGFMAHHLLLLGHLLGWNQPWTYVLSASIACGGALWAWLYEWSQGLGPSWISHLLVDATIFGLGYLMIRPMG